MKLNKIDAIITMAAFAAFLVSAILFTGFTRPYLISVVLTMVSASLFSFITVIIWKKMGEKLFNKWKNIKNEQ